MSGKLFENIESIYLKTVFTRLNVFLMGASFVIAFKDDLHSSSRPITALGYWIIVKGLN